MIKSLDKEGLLSFVLGTALKPVFPVAGTDEQIRLFYRWMEFNNAAETAILASLGKSQLSLITSCKSAAEMWGRLQNLYMHSSEVNIARLERELHNLKWKRNSSLESFLQEIDRVADSLRGCGQDVPDSRLRMTLLDGIPNRLDYVKHILLQLGPQPYYVLCDQLRSHVALASAGDSKALLSSSEKPASGHNKSNKPKDKQNTSEMLGLRTYLSDRQTAR